MSHTLDEWKVLDREHAALNTWEEVVAFGMELEAILISEGYKARCQFVRDYPTHLYQILLDVDSINSYIQVWYCNERPGTYSVSGRSDADYSKWISNVVGIGTLLETIPALVSDLIEGSQRMRVRKQCSLCHYSAEFYPDGDSGYCGKGLVSNGYCSHYVGPTPYNNEGT
jgi:hypothetical protein